jgi:hypothetical protein
MQARSLLLSVVLLLATAPLASAIERATSGTPVRSAECRRVQLEAQAAVLAGAPYRNHGGMVSTAAKVVSAAVAAGRIDEDCASCIVNQFARNVPIAEQEPCGELGITANLLGPQVNACDGPAVGTTTITSLPNGDIDLTITFTSGPPNASWDVYWTCTNVAFGCHDDACGFIHTGTISTDAAGHGTATHVIAGGNPYPGKYVHIDLGPSPAGIFTSVFGDVPAVVAPTTTLAHYDGDPTKGLAAMAGTPNANGAAAAPTPTSKHTWGWVKQIYR